MKMPSPMCSPRAALVAAGEVGFAEPGEQVRRKPGPSSARSGDTSRPPSPPDPDCACGELDARSGSGCRARAAARAPAHGGWPAGRPARRRAARSRARLRSRIGGPAALDQRASGSRSPGSAAPSGRVDELGEDLAAALGLLSSRATSAASGLSGGRSRAISFATTAMVPSGAAELVRRGRRERTERRDGAARGRAPSGSPPARPTCAAPPRRRWKT